jgi:hypothetical protein
MPCGAGVWLAAGLGLATILAPRSAAAAASDKTSSQLIVWAWERPEDLRFLPADVEIAVQTGFIELSGDHLFARPRRFPLLADPSQVTTRVVHVQIRHRKPLEWTDTLRRQTASAVLKLGHGATPGRLQLDFEVRASERQVLLDLISDLRTQLPDRVSLSMTALASWCQTETWLDAVPVDEITPMLFRMGPSGERVRSLLAQGGEFAEARCRKALGVSADAPLIRAPGGRRVYLFNPRSWSEPDFARVQKEVEAWDVAAREAGARN